MINFTPLPACLEAIETDVPDNHLFYFRLPQPLPIAPGQFVELSLPGIGAFPVSAVTWPTSDLLQLCIRRVGRVTSALYRLEIGAAVGIRGPFGRGFPVENFLGKDVLLVAGGLGMVPLRTLLHWLLAHREGIGELTVLYGSYDVARLLFRRELETLAVAGTIRLAFSVDAPGEDPRGKGAIPCRFGVVSDLLADLDFNPATTVAAVCGPPVLYAHFLEKLATAGVPSASIYASLERRMKCGVGQCCHCVTAGVYICCQGPVFSLDELRMMPGAI
jgi:NAD(P)H-flavin reductase